MKNQNGIEVFQSRWGYHPVSFQTFLKMKAVYKAYWEAVRRRAAWNRWDRKLYKKRKGIVLVEPPYTELDVDLVNSGIEIAFRMARIPVAKPDDVIACPFTDAVLNTMLARIDAPPLAVAS